MVQFRKWTSIKGFHNIKKTYDAQEKEGKIYFPFSLLQKYGTPTFKAKTKLHGQNAAVNIEPKEVGYQSRNTLIQKDSKFGRVAAPLESYWLSLIDTTMYKRVVVYGEFCGAGVQKNVALTQLKHDLMAVFAIQLETISSKVSQDDEDSSGGYDLIIEPEQIQAFLTKDNTIDLPTHIHVLPWYKQGQSWSISLAKTDEKVLDSINKEVESIDKEDPWVKRVFGFQGHGEGLVLYPVSFADPQTKLIMRTICSTFMFKAKGASHSVTKSKKAVQINPETLASISEYVNYMCVDERMTQGAQDVCGKSGDELVYNFKLIKSFIEWVQADVQKEGADELDNSGLTWAQVAKPIKAYASKWYSTRAKAAMKKR